MKILYILDNYYPHIGGAELLFQQLAEGVVAQGHSATVLTPKNFPEYIDTEQHNKVTIIRQRVPMVGQRYFFTLWAIAKAIRLARSHDLIHTATYNAIFPAWLASLLTGKRALVTVYEVWNEKWYSLSGQKRWKAHLLRLFERVLLLFRFDATICISDSTLRDYKQLFPKAAAVRIYPGVDYAEIEKYRLSEVEKQQFQARNGYATGSYVVLSFGRPGISKGFDNLVEAVPAVLEALPSVTFKFIWPSAPNFISLRDVLTSRLASFNVPESVAVLDKQTRADLFAHIQAADCVVIPSLAEGFGYAAIEACLLASCTVVTTAGSLPEIVNNRVIQVAPASHQALAQGIISAARGEAPMLPPKTFTNKAMIDGHISLYTSLVSPVNNRPI
ncbi:glycosyltransferase family 4 protein [Fibrivirga algicola]|uniref:Glycosyltransferase family 4 protein n=1 Tax=Fibrivirga algicola TaxID=2950420 RepID=A0ABX0QKW8_9BACT|nr:glycosyltransferase family 4 protein [Fibrivirga algicola]NID11901.1 glycosyltransferase family 4 protein [Fibrivirga algicola]